MDVNARIGAIVDRLAGELIGLRRTIHQHPELAFEEHETAKLVSGYLGRLGIPHRTGVGRTGVVGLLECNGAGRTVAIRADMDALPIHEETNLPFASKLSGKMHACGHDAHTVIALGVAAVLAELKDQLRGRIKLIFQPAEETLGGAPAMIADGVLDNPKPDVILGYHNWPQLPSGKVGYHPEAVMASSDAFGLTIKGVTGHGAHPHLAVDAIAGAAQFVTQVQTVVSRETAPLNPAVITIGQFIGGTARNVIAGTVELKGSVRTLDPPASQRVEAALRRMLDGLKLGMRLDYTLDYRRLTPVLRNNKEMLQRVLSSARDVLGAGNIVEMPQPSMGSEDFAWFAERIPAAHLRIGSKIDGLDTAIHRSNYDCSDQAIAVGVKVVARAALDLLGASEPSVRHS
ncbi:MAG: amidohydrolase [Proteobacteria bacterium]|nr:amidohydrolase [Pseudomonadota bacterium]